MPVRSDKPWWVYLLRCGNGSLYTGVTTDVGRRTDEHQDSGRRAARFTRAFSPVELLYQCRIGSKRQAFQVEYRIKRLTRRQKVQLVAQNLSKSGLLAFLGMEDRRDHRGGSSRITPRNENCE